jgi:pimeloyl-ACP methyl ester carboxylesterase
VADYDSYRVLAGRIRMHVLDWPGEGTPLLFLHSFTANGLAALPLGRLLFERRRVIAPDLRGRGNSDMPFGEYGVQTHIRDLIACLDRMEVGPVVASGHSFGATISLFLAAKYPERVSGLLLFDGGAIPGRQAIEYLNAYYDTIQYRYATAEEYVDRYRNSPLYQPWTEDLEELVRSNLFQEPDGSFIRRVARYIVQADRRDEHLEAWQQIPELYPKIQCPVLIIRAGMGIVGREDQVLPDEVIATMLEGMPSAQVVTIEEAGHTSLLTVPNEQRDEAILQFLDGIA